MATFCRLRDFHRAPGTLMLSDAYLRKLVCRPQLSGTASLQPGVAHPLGLLPLRT